MKVTMTEQEKAEVLSAPAQTVGQILIWCEDLGVEIHPNDWVAARSLPSTTPLREVLARLGAEI